MPDKSVYSIESASATICSPSDSDSSHLSQQAHLRVEPLDARLDRLITFGFAALVIYSVIRNAVQVSAVQFWFDEVITAIITRQPGIVSIWKALANAADTNPPLYYLLEKFIVSFIPNEHVALRIPSIAAFACVLWCLFVFIRRRSGALVAAVAAMVPLVTILWEFYAEDARSYGLFVACIAVALVCYQRAPERRWMIAMGASLLLGECFHYYALFGIVPFAAAEAVLYLKTKWVRPSVWIALACGLLPLILFWPLLARVKSYYAGTNWAPPTFVGTIGIYSWLFNLDSPFDRFFPIFTVQSIAIVLLTAIGAVCAISLLVYQAVKARPEDEPFFHENILVAGFLGLPFVIFVAMKITNGGGAERYMLPAILGISIAASYVLQRTRRSIVVLLGVSLLATFGIGELTSWITYRGTDGVGSNIPKIEAFTKPYDLPVVISPMLAYLPFAYYGSPQWNNHFVALVDLPESVAYMDFDSGDRQLLVLRSLVPIPVYEFGKFRKDHSKFLLYSLTSGSNKQDWWPVFLIREGYSLKRVSNSGHASIYLVTQNGTPADSENLPSHN